MEMKAVEGEMGPGIEKTWQELSEIFSFLFFFLATPAAYGSSQARDRTHA